MTSGARLRIFHALLSAFALVAGCGNELTTGANSGAAGKGGNTGAAGAAGGTAGAAGGSAGVAGGTAGAAGGSAGVAGTGGTQAKGGGGGTSVVGGAGGAAVAGSGGSGGKGSGGTGGAGGSGGVAGSGGAGDSSCSVDCTGFTIPPDHPIEATTYLRGVDTITDQFTGLMWQRKLTAADRMTSLIARCSTPDLAGHTDWRIPTVLELATIVDLGVRDPAIATTSFPDTPSDYYFATTTNVYNIGSRNVWTVNFSTGLTVNGVPPETYVRCVRREHSPVTYSGPRFRVGGKSDPANLTVYDMMTGLRWARAVSSDPLSWANAKTYCAAMGGTARLPTTKELLSLVDWSKAAAIDLDLFPDTPKDGYWSVTAAAGSTTEALAVSFGDATYTGSRTAKMTDTLQVRCIVGQGAP